MYLLYILADKKEICYIGNKVIYIAEFALLLPKLNIDYPLVLGTAATLSGADFYV